MTTFSLDAAGALDSLTDDNGRTHGPDCCARAADSFAREIDLQGILDVEREWRASRESILATWLSDGTVECYCAEAAERRAEAMAAEAAATELRDTALAAWQATWQARRATAALDWSAYCVRCGDADLAVSVLCRRDGSPFSDNGADRDADLSRFEGLCLRCCEHNHG